MSRLRVIQFNCLAPSARICRPLDAIPWFTRHTAICEAILRLNPDVVCIQEFCFTTPGFGDLYQSHLGDTYTMHTKRRTGGKPEGLAVLLRHGAFENVRIDAIELEPRFCDRVAMEYLFLCGASIGLSGWDAVTEVSPHRCRLIGVIPAP